jgi:tryptophan synthase alpha chain
MSNIAKAFGELRRSGRKGFIPFVSAGDPDMGTSLEIVKALARSGATVIELGVPFSDPMADGPTIQRSSQRSLAAGTDLGKIVDMVKEFRRESDVPIVLFSYLNPLLRFGFDKLCTAARETGIDGILVTDVVGGEAKEIGSQLRNNGVDLISLIAPTTTDERLAEITSTASGFVYAVSRAGVTGARSEMTSDAERLVARARRFTNLPIAVGFGISTAEQVRSVWEYADAAVIGSAIVSVIEKSAGVEDPASAVERFARSIVPEIANQTQEV